MQNNSLFALIPISAWQKSFDFKNYENVWIGLKIEKDSDSPSHRFVAIEENFQKFSGSELQAACVYLGSLILLSRIGFTILISVLSNEISCTLH